MKKLTFITKINQIPINHSKIKLLKMKKLNLSLPTAACPKLVWGNLFRETRFWILLIPIIIGTLNTNIANAQWQSPSPVLSGAKIWALASDGTNIFAGIWGSTGVYKSTDNGNSWTRANTGLDSPTNGVYSLAISGTKIIAGTAGNGVFLSTNSGSSWTAVNNGLTGFALNVRGVAIFGTKMFAGTNVGVFVSTNDGSSWTAVPELTNATVTAFAISGTNIFAATNNAAGLWISTDNGSSWNLANNSLPLGSYRSIAISGTNIFVGGNDVYLSTNNGALWTKVSNGLPNITVYSLAISGTKIFAGTAGKVSTTGLVYLSTNNGTSWTAVNTGFSSTVYNCLALSVLGTDIIAGTQNGGIQKRPLSDFPTTPVTPVANFNARVNNLIIYPNPYQSTTTISYELSKKTIVSLEIYNLLGKRIYFSWYHNLLH